MDENTQIETMQILLDNDPSATSEVCSVYLSVAAEMMLKRLYPFDPTQTEIPNQYSMTQCELAVRLFLKRGAEGETSHNENGINRTYWSVNDEDILARLTPYAKIAVKNTEETN